MKVHFFIFFSLLLLQYVLGAVWFSEVERINGRERIK
jgi:hypothetical protein